MPKNTEKENTSYLQHHITVQINWVQMA